MALLLVIVGLALTIVGSFMSGIAAVVWRHPTYLRQRPDNPVVFAWVAIGLLTAGVVAAVVGAGL